MRCPVLWVRAQRVAAVLLVVGALPLAGARAAECPKPEQPALSQTLSRWNEAGRSSDVMDCAISIAGENNPADLPDEVRYQIANLMSEAMANLFRNTAPLRLHAAAAADAWQAYLQYVKEPRDDRRLRFALTKLMQNARYDGFDQRVRFIASSVGKARQAIDITHANLLFSTLKRCPSWTIVRAKLACSKECAGHAETAVSELRKELGTMPWQRSPGLVQLSANAAALEEERAQCASTE